MSIKLNEQVYKEDYEACWRTALTVVLNQLKLKKMSGVNGLIEPTEDNGGHIISFNPLGLR